MQINSVAEYLEVIKQYKKYPCIYYRGQRDVYKTFTPSIARDSGYLSNENNIYHETIQMCASEFNGLNTPLDRLAKMQHYEIPTRLVDLTIDPLAALYFAVEKIDDAEKSNGNVYLYAVSGVSQSSKKARVLSILPMLSTLEADTIKAEFEHLFEDTISQDEILEMVSMPAILQYSDDLEKSNPRLYHQKGTFLICGNDVVNGIITNTLKSLDEITPLDTIRIPYEYKKSVKDELDIKHGINKYTIYPELPSVGSYIREKYKEENMSFNDKYSIVEIDDTSIAAIHRISITVVLHEKMSIEQIKALVVEIIE